MFHLFAQAPALTEDSIIMLGISLLTGILGMPLIQYLKTKLGWSSTKARLLAAAVAALLAIIDQSLAGQLSLSTVVLDNFYEVFTSVFAVATLVYGLFNAYQEKGGLG